MKRYIQTSANPRRGGQGRSGPILPAESSGRRAVAWDALEPRALMSAAVPVVTGLTLINADTDQPVESMPLLTEGAVLDLSALPTTHLNVRADANPGAASVKFGYDAAPAYHVESTSPFALAANNGPDYYAWTPAVGAYTLRVTPYDGPNATGTAGKALTVRFTVVAGPPAVSLTASDPSAGEGGTDGGAFVVTRTGPTTKPLTVNLDVAGTAEEGEDYQPLPRSVTIPAGSASATVAVRTLDDADPEPVETVVVRLADGSGYTIAPAATATVTIAASDAPAPQKFVVSASPAGTTGLDVIWTPPAGVDGVLKYRITYTPGAYLPGQAGGPQTVEVDADDTSAALTGLEPFTLYSVDVAAVGEGGDLAAAHTTAWTAATATQKRYLYAVDLPKNRQGFKTLKPQIEVFDVNAGHQWVKNIPLPKGIYNVRGVAASAATDRLYVSFLTGPNDGGPGGLLCLDLNTSAVLWKRTYDPALIPSPDRLALTPDGKKIYLPSGENGTTDYWVVIDAVTGTPGEKIHHVSSPHNTVMSVDGRFAYLEGQEKGPEPAAVARTVAVVDTATDTVVGRVGPFKDVIRPFTVNGKGSLIFATVNNLIGFQVADVATGKVLYTAAPPGVKQPDPKLNLSHSHGIALTPDEREAWVVDTDHAGIHVWDVSALPAGAPKYVGFIRTRRTGQNLAGQSDPAASNDATGTPSWLVASYDGKYTYAESGEVIDVAAHKVISQLRAKTTDTNGKVVFAPYTHSRFMLEVDFDGGQAVRVTDQFGIGRVR